MRKFLGYKSRSVWKGYNFISLNEEDCSRNYIVKLKDKGKVVKVYNGYKYILFTCLKRYVGFKLGQFVLTKKIGRFIHGVLKPMKKGAKKGNKVTKNIKSVKSFSKKGIKSTVKSQMKKKKKK
jgi:ribosomal protein S19